MKLEDLKPGGLYRIVRATPNPNRDRRVNSEWVRMDLPEGGELLCTFTQNRDRDLTAQTIELTAFGGGLAGIRRYAGRALVGWMFDDGRVKQRMSNDQDDSYAKFVTTLLDVIEPFEPRDVDDALAVFNATHRPEISYEHIALTLLDEATAPTIEAFERTRKRLEAFDVETGDDSREYERRFTEFNAKAYKPEPAPAGDPEPDHTVRYGGREIQCHGCDRVFMSEYADPKHNGSAAALFTAHLPCKGPGK